MFCPYCKELNVQTEESRRFERIVSMFILLPLFILFIILQVPQKFAIIAGVTFLAGFFFSYPFILDVGKRKMN